MKLLVVNAGSSSLKFNVTEMPSEEILISGYIERIGSNDSFYNIKINGEKIKTEKYVENHTEAVKVLFDELFNHKVIESLDEIKGVGHRVLHGGEKYSKSVIITDEVIKDIESLTKLGPLHHPGNLAGINAMKNVLPNVKNVAVYDTAFHQTMPEENYIYPVPYEWYKKYSVRKYGFHGTSHKYITEEMKKRLNKENCNLIICHIGSGGSLSCIKDGKCFDTTMGLTPLDGIMMGTRSGSIDPSILEYVCKESGEDVSSITNKLNKESGFLGLTGVADNRDIEKMIADNDKMAILAMDMYTNRVRDFIGKYYLELEGNVDQIVFTAGLGENGALFRSMVVNKLACLGLKLDEKMNDSIASFKDIHEGYITTPDSKIPVLVLPTDEEIMIVRDTYELINK